MLQKQWIEDILYGERSNYRYTQDTPVLPDVWYRYAQNGGQKLSLLLTPSRDTSPSFLAGQVGRPENQDSRRTAFNQTVVVAELTYQEMLREVLPLSVWWEREVAPQLGDQSVSERLRELANLAGEQVGALLEGDDKVIRDLNLSKGLVLMIRVAGTLTAAIEQTEPLTEEGWKNLRRDPRALTALAEVYEDPPKVAIPGTLWKIQLNRTAQACTSYSSRAVKADAARQLFGISCKNLVWGVVDSGVDARHSAFRKRKADGKLENLNSTKNWSANSRVLRSFDFTRLRELVQQDLALLDAADAVRNVQSRLLAGADVDWKKLGTELEITHDESYKPPRNAHGTHVAGILGGDLRESDGTDSETLPGICPDIEIYDLRVLTDDGEGDEFSVMAALQFIRYLNSKSERMVVHGANLSLSLFHDVKNYACGRTPICDECERLVANGVTTVVAAGNQGYHGFETKTGAYEGYQDISITDPGNAEGVITVGSTHRYRPHTYGVSYFSSRGPTGDGRAKPDLVAPGEKIRAPVPNGEIDEMDGTSMAAPHVSGACALIMARHTEFTGQPVRIKGVLCRTATDLGRDRYFQGAGMLDVLRALQSV